MAETGSRDLPTWLWDYEVNRAINEAMPDLLVDFFAIMTRFGDGATVVAFAMLFYWFGSDDNWNRRGMLLAIAISTLALNAGLKGILDVARPLFAAEAAGEPLAFAPEFYPGLSTPSAHSMGAAAIYAGLAVLMDIGKKWQRYLVAGFLIVTVPMSRVVLGLHYVGDIILGVVLGLALVYFALYLERKVPRSALSLFGFAVIVAVLAPIFGSREFVTMSIGASVGGFVAWWYVRDREPDPYGASILVLGLLLIPVFLLLRVVESLVVIDVFIEVAGAEVPLTSIFATIGYGVLFGLGIVVPIIAERLDDWLIVQQLQARLPFEGRTVDTDEIVEDVGERPSRRW